MYMSAVNDTYLMSSPSLIILVFQKLCDDLGGGDLFSFHDLLIVLDLREDSVILLLLLSVKSLGSCDCSLDKD